MREPDGRVWTVNGSGFGPDGGTAEEYLDRGLTAVPMAGPQAVATPGAIGALATLHALGGSRDPRRAVGAGRRGGRARGVPCTAKNRRDITEHAGALAARPGSGPSGCCPTGRSPRSATCSSSGSLADSIVLLARRPRALYEGELAERAVTLLRAGGAPFSGDEWLLGGEMPAEAAISAPYGDVTVHQTPPPSPGWMLLQQAGLLDGLLTELPTAGAESVHLLAQAARRAFRDRYERCASDNERLARSARRRRAGPGPPGARSRAGGRRGPGRDGRRHHQLPSPSTPTGAPSAPSPRWPSRSARASRSRAPAIALNNRLGPRRLPRARASQRAARPGASRCTPSTPGSSPTAPAGCGTSGNTPGGDGQVQWNMQLVSHLVDGGLDPQEAVRRRGPRCIPGSDADALGAPETLQCESRLGADVLADARRARSRRPATSGDWGGGGSALVVSVDQERGVLSGAADPRQDGVALGV